MSGTRIMKGFGQVAFVNPQWKAGLDDKDVQLALVCEAIDFRDVSHEFDDKPYPVGLHCDIMVHPKHMSKDYKDRAESSMDGKTIFDLASYGGGVPATNFLEGIESPSAKSKVKSRVDDDNARWFKDADDALKYANDVYKKNADALFSMIGFTLDKSINRAGNSGWDVIKSQVTGKHWMNP